jgi:hypothetical protein
MSEDNTLDFRSLGKSRPRDRVRPETPEAAASPKKAEKAPERRSRAPKREVTVQVNARLPESVAEEMRRICFEDKISYADLILEMYEAWKEKYGEQDYAQERGT